MTARKYQRAPSFEEGENLGRIRSSSSSNTTLVAIPFHDTSSSKESSTSLTRRLNRRRTNWFARLARPRLPFGLSKRYSGWRLGVLGSIICVFTVFLINLTVTIWAAATHPVKGGTGILYQGNCDKATTISIWLHIAINILSTVSLSCSNFVSQCLIAPLRSEIDKAHRKRRWMDIGVPSVRNLWMVDWKRMGLWWVIGFSSLPLHLLYNSAVFGTTAANSFVVMIGNQNLFEPESVAALRSNYTRYQDERLTYNGSYYPMTIIDVDALAFLELNETTDGEGWTTFTPEECLTQYNKDMLDHYSDVFVVLEGDETAKNLTGLYCSSRGLNQWTNNLSPPKDWIGENNGWYDPHTSASRDPSKILSDVKNGIPWTKCGKGVKECRARNTPKTAENCKVQFSLVILPIVIAFNLLKVVAMTLALRRSKERPIVTIGDAVQSFMQKPDITTEGMCCTDKEFFLSAAGTSAWKLGLKTPVTWQGSRKRWWQAVRWTRWTVCYFLVSVAFITVCILLKSGLDGDSNHGLGIDLKSIWEKGIGQASLESLVSLGSGPNGGPDMGLVSAALVSNIPQVILSSLYFIYNGIFTCMLMAAEYSRFALHRKALRVTDPTGDQRSTHFLHLPYTYSIPLGILSFGLHWLTSQCIFLVSLEFLPSPVLVATFKSEASFTNSADIYEEGIEVISSCGYSVGAIILILPTIVLAMIVPWAIGMRRFESEMPIVGSCSAAISAACHREPVEDLGKESTSTSEVDLSYRGYELAGSDEEEMELDEVENMKMRRRRKGLTAKPLQWGVTVLPKENGGVGHLAFSAEEVEAPENFAKYA